MGHGAPVGGSAPLISVAIFAAGPQDYNIIHDIVYRGPQDYSYNDLASLPHFDDVVVSARLAMWGWPVRLYAMHVSAPLYAMVAACGDK